MIFSSVHSWPVFIQFSGSQAAFGTSFTVIGGNRKAEISFMKRVTERIFTVTVERDFTEASININLDFHKKTAKNGENHQR